MTINKPKQDALAIFCAAIELSSVADQVDYVENACGDNPGLRREVQALLSSNCDAGSFLADDGQATSLFVTPNADSIREGAGSRIGRYKLLQEIGEGGFGVVFMAEQQEPVHRKVAVKIIKRGMDTKEVVARFEAERQALALMDHPNIARVLDGGQTESGRPYFAMELVRGVPLTEFCDTNKLSVNNRVKLFVTVCRAIEHAHKKGIIHRDLKPSNVMVTLHDSQPVPKIIDFGVSKAISQRLTEKTLFTAYGQMVGTPVYMSPEQARFSGLDIDTRSDVYSLGVLFYELLTGTTPLCAEKVRSTGYAEMQRMIVEDEAPNPSTRLSTLGDQKASIAIFRGTDSKELQQFLRGDLDWIVMKALEKERSRRYQSANDFADDIERFLADEEIEARPPSTAYKLQKFVHRNRGLVIGATALMVMLCLGLLGTSLGLIAAKRAAINERKAREDAVAKEGLASAAEKEARDAESKARDAESLANLAKQGAEAAEQQAVLARDQAKQAAEINRQLLYAANVQLASSGNNNIEGDAHGLLAAWIPVKPPTSQKPDLREFAWRRQWTRLYEGGIHSVLDANAATVSRSGNLITADAKGIREWFPTGELLAWRWQGDATRTMFSPNGVWALIPSAGAVDLVEISSGESFHTFPKDRFVFSSDSQYVVVSGSQREIEVFRIEGKRVLLSGGLDLPEAALPLSRYRFSLSPDGQTFVARTRSHEATLVFADGERTLNWQHASGIQCFAWSSDGQLLASGDGAGQMFLRHVSRPGYREVLGSYGKGISCLAFAPDAKRLAAGRGNGTTEIWNVSKSGSGLFVQLDQVIGGSASVRSLVFSADGSKLATLDSRSAARLWDLSNPNGRHEFKRNIYDQVGDVGIVWEQVGSEFIVKELIPNGPAEERGKIHIGDRVVRMSGELVDRAFDTADSIDVPRAIGISAGPRGSVVKLEIEDRETLRRDVVDLVCSLPVQFYGYDHLAISPDGKFVTTANSIVGAACWTTEGQFVQFYPAIGSEVRYSDDGRWLALSDQNEVLLWDRKSDQEHTRLPARCSCMAFSPDGKHLVLGSADRDGGYELQLFDLPSLKRVKTWEVAAKHGAFDRRGDMFVSMDFSGEVTVWNAKTWKRQRSFFVGHGGPLAISPDGSAIACAGPWIVDLWDPRSGKFLKHFSSPTNPHDLAFSPDGRTLASGTVFWDAKTGNPLRYYREHETIMPGVEFSRDGQMLASLSKDGTLYVQKSRTFDEIEQHPLTLRSTYDLAKLRASQKRFVEAEAILKYTLERQTASLPPAHTDIADTRSLLKNVLVAQHKVPTIAHSLQWQYAKLGESIRFEVTTVNEGPWKYQWFHDSARPAGATDRMLTVSTATANDFGTYHVEIQTDESGAMISPTRGVVVLIDESNPVVSGALLREVYLDIPGLLVEQLTNAEKYRLNQPDIVDVLFSCEAPSDVFENYGQRLRGFLLPPKTGNYVFYLASDDESELYISSDESPDNYRLEARLKLSGRRDWALAKESVSRPIYLEAGKRYAIQTLMKESLHNDHLAVTWQMPGDPPPRIGDPPIPGEFLGFRWERNDQKSAP